MNPYLKIFFATGPLFGFIYGLVMAVLLWPVGIILGPILGVFGGLSFGAGMSLILGTINRRKVRQAHLPPHIDGSNVNQTGSVELSLPCDGAFDLSLSALTTIVKCSVKTANRETGQIMARTGRSWWSWGEKLTLHINRINSSHARVDVSSRQALGTTIIDYGRNFENVAKLVSFLAQNSSKPLTA